MNAKKRTLLGRIDLMFVLFFMHGVNISRRKKGPGNYPKNVSEEIMVISDNRNNSKSLFENKISKEVLEDYNSRNLGEVLKTITGVSTLNSGNYLSKPVINGLHSSRIILINNDVRLEDQEWGIEHAPKTGWAGWILQFEVRKLLASFGLTSIELSRCVFELIESSRLLVNQ